MFQLNENKQKKPKMNLRIKILLGSLILSLITSVSLAFTSYKILEKELYKEYKDRLKNTSELGSRIIDSENLKKLISKIQPEMSESYLTEIYSSEEFKQISKDLNSIRDSKKDLIQYVYIWLKTDQENKVLFIADADVLEQVSKGQITESKEEISHFGSSYDISFFKEAKVSIQNKISAVENDFVYDKDFNVFSVSGFSPIFDKSNKDIATLGIDMTDTNIRLALKKATLVSTIIGIITIFVACIASLLLGNLFVKPILELNKVVLQFGEKDFSVRGLARSKDEVGMLTNNFNHMAETIVAYDSQIKEMIEAMKKFVPFEFLNFLHRDNITNIQLGDQVNQEMTVFFSDIRSFTKISESMTPKETFNFINSYLKRMGPLIRQNHGFIDKYIGDAIMAIFAKGPDDALKAGLDILIELKLYNSQRKSVGYEPIHIGIGIHTGNLMLGTIGEQERMDTTVIADSVNLGSRLEGLTKYYGVSMIISETSLKKLVHPDQFYKRFLGLVQVVGKEEAIGLYEVYNSDDEKSIQAKEQTKENFEDGVFEFNKGNLLEAHRLMKSVYEKNPEDKVAILYLKKIKFYYKNGLPENWNGVEKMTSK